MPFCLPVRLHQSLTYSPPVLEFLAPRLLQGLPHCKVVRFQQDNNTLRLGVPAGSSRSFGSVRVSTTIPTKRCLREGSRGRRAGPDCALIRLGENEPRRRKIGIRNYGTIAEAKSAASEGVKSTAVASRGSVACFRNSGNLKLASRGTRDTNALEAPDHGFPQKGGRVTDKVSLQTAIEHKVPKSISGEHADADNLMEHAWTLANRKAWADAMEIIPTAISAGAPAESLSMMKLCTVLLDVCRKDNYENPNLVISMMQRHGITINIFHYNVLMQNAFEKNDFPTGWKIYRLARRHPVALDSWSYTILLKACRKSNRKDLFRKMYRRLKLDNVADGHPHLVAEIIYSFSYFTSRSGFDRVLRAYESYCDLTPLKNLGMIPTDYTARDIPLISSPLPVPTTRTLVVTIQSFVRTAANYNQYRLIRLLYHQVQKKQRSGDHVIAPLMLSRAFYHVLLKALSKHRSFAYLWGILKHDMQTACKEDGMRRSNSLSSRHEPFSPDVKTWNIALNGLAHGQRWITFHRAYYSMLSHGITPDSITWTTMLTGYARFGRIDDAVRVLGKMKLDGLGVDDWTLKALARFDNQQQLLRSIQADPILSGQTGRVVPRKEMEGLSDLTVLDEDDHFMAASEGTSNITTRVDGAEESRPLPPKSARPAEGLPIDGKEGFIERAVPSDRTCVGEES